jgi:hypothetical protein
VVFQLSLGKQLLAIKKIFVPKYYAGINVTVAGSGEHGKEPSVSIKCWHILELLSDWWLLEKD